MRDLIADWEKWSSAERLLAMLLTLMLIALPVRALIAAAPLWSASLGQGSSSSVIQMIPVFVATPENRTFIFIVLNFGWSGGPAVPSTRSGLSPINTHSGKSAAPPDLLSNESGARALLAGFRRLPHVFIFQSRWAITLRSHLSTTERCPCPKLDR